MRDRRRRAGGVQAEKQQRYVQLIAQGVSNSEACRLVGIDRKTGNRWRYGRRVRNSAGALVIYPPVKITESRPRSPRYLSEQERIRIADLLAAASRSAGSPWSSAVRRRRSAVRSLATATRTGATGRITLSRPRGCGLPGRARGGSPATACWPKRSNGCWRSAGAPSRSRMSFACCSKASRCAGCARSRSTRRSTTLRWLSPGRRVGGAAGDVYKGCSDAAG